MTEPELFFDDDEINKELIMALARGHEGEGITEAQVEILLAKVHKADVLVLTCRMAAQGLLNIRLSPKGKISFKTSEQGRSLL